MTDLSLAYTPATTLARLIGEKTISPVEVVQNSLARIEEVNGALNAFCFTYPEEALAQAREAERAVMAGEVLGPLHGVPIAIKDLTPTKGKRTTLGSRIYENWVPDFDVPIVERLRAAGSILVGKTATPRVRLCRLLQERALGRHQQSLGYDALAGRLVGRIGGGGRGRLRAARRGHRRGRLGPHPGGLLRHRRTETDLRAHPAPNAADRVRRSPSLRPAFANGCGRCALPRRHPGP